MAHARSHYKDNLRMIILGIAVALFIVLLFLVGKQVASQSKTAVLKSKSQQSIAPDPFGKAGVAPLPWRPRGVAPDPFGKKGVAPDPFGRTGVAPDPFGRRGVAPLPW